MPGAPSSVLSPGSHARRPLVASLLLVAMPGVAMPGAPSVLAPGSDARRPLVASLLLVAMPGAPSSVLAPSSDARSP